MCFGATSYKVKSKAAWVDSVREESSGSFAHSRRSDTRRYGPHRSYYPAQYYARAADCGGAVGALQYASHFSPRGGVVPGGRFYGGGRQLVGGRAALPGHTAMRSYYYPTTIAAPAVAYAYPAVASAAVVPTSTTYTVTNSHVPQMTTTTTTTRSTMPPVMQTPGPSRTDIQMENRRIATERGAYNIRNIKPADARPDDPFWCKERTGEWHLRTFYQIENECYPGRWHMNPDEGFLVFHRA